MKINLFPLPLFFSWIYSILFYSILSYPTRRRLFIDNHDNNSSPRIKKNDSD